MYALKKRRKFDGITIIAALAAVMATGCGLFSEDSTDGEFNEETGVNTAPHTDMIPVHHGFETPGYPIAVGAMVDIRTADNSPIHDVFVEDPQIFEVIAIDSDTTTLRALAEGESRFDVVTAYEDDHPMGDSLSLTAMPVAEAILRPDCSILDMADDFLGVPYSGERIWLTDQIYSAEQELFDPSDRFLAGYGYYPFDVDPEGAIQFDRGGTGSKMDLITGSQQGEALVESIYDGTSLAMVLHHEEDVDELAIVRAEDADDDVYFSVTRPGDEPMLDLVDNQTYTFIAHRFVGERAVCEPGLSATFVVTTQTPEICELTDLGAAPESHESIELSSDLLTTNFGQLYLHSQGECTVEVEYTAGPAGYELSDQWTWVVE